MFEALRSWFANRLGHIRTGVDARAYIFQLGAGFIGEREHGFFVLRGGRI
jgi:hypothetical protein